jgi:beta-mannosidase
VRERAVGVRTLELDQRPDPEEPGTRFFRFVLNGVGIFARTAPRPQDVSVRAR